MDPASSLSLKSLADLLERHVEDLYDVEQRLPQSFAKMADAASSSPLAEAFRHHGREAEQHVKRLERVFAVLQRAPRAAAAGALSGVLVAGETMWSAADDDAVRDAALIAAAQRVDHCSIAGYGTARALARHLGFDEAAALLQTTLDEVTGADKRLTRLAEQAINPKAVERPRNAGRSKSNPSSS